MRSCTSGWPGHLTFTTKSRGNDSSDSDLLIGSARTRISVSDRPVSSDWKPFRRSVPITSAIVGWLGSARSRRFAAAISDFVFGLIASTNWCPFRYAAPPAAAPTISATSTVQTKIIVTSCHAPRLGGSGCRYRVIGVGGDGGKIGRPFPFEAEARPMALLSVVFIGVLKQHGARSRAPADPEDSQPPGRPRRLPLQALGD